MIPKSSNGLLRHCIVIISAAIVIEDGKLFFGHHICRGLPLNSPPYITDITLKQCCDSRRDLAILILFGHFEGFCNGQLSI